MYYRVYLNHENLICVCCMQWFDEYDYERDRFVRDAGGSPLQFDDELSAKTFVNRTYKLEVIHPTDVLPSHPSLLLAGVERHLAGADLAEATDSE